ncbi:MAG TPA: hypothetical protein VHA13_00365 [Gammaproteobacteria bacterium]|nr:hypothetical protein [Gammaproteobacteria bacterium]
MIRLTYKNWWRSVLGVTHNLANVSSSVIIKKARMTLFADKVNLPQKARDAYESPDALPSKKYSDQNTEELIHPTKMRLHHYIFYKLYTWRLSLFYKIDKIASSHKKGGKSFSSSPLPRRYKFLKLFLMGLFIIPEFLTLSIAKIPTHMKKPARSDLLQPLLTPVNKQHESSTTKTPKPQHTTSTCPSLFEKNNNYSAIVSEEVTCQSSKLIHRAPHFNEALAEVEASHSSCQTSQDVINVLFKDNNQNKINSIKIIETINQGKIYSELKHTDIDIPLCLYEFVKHLLPSNFDKQFFKKGIKQIKIGHKEITEKGFAALFANSTLDSSLISQVSNILYRSYVSYTEQVFDKEHFPNDNLIRMAKHQVDQFIKTSEKITVSKAWDPHYVEAIELYCAMKGYKVYNKSGWVLSPISPSKHAKFEKLFNQRFKNIEVYHTNPSDHGPHVANSQ